jgi:hypothetical protein
VKAKHLKSILLFVLFAVIASLTITVHYRTQSEENRVTPTATFFLENATFHSIPDIIENSSDYWGKAITVEGYYTLLSECHVVGGEIGISSYIPSIGILTESPVSTSFLNQQTNEELSEIALLTVGGGNENIGVPNFDNTTKIELIPGGKYRVTGILMVDSEFYLHFFSVYLEVFEFSEVN